MRNKGGIEVVWAIRTMGKKLRQKLASEVNI
jgi:hypothetical protein